MQSKTVAEAELAASKTLADAAEAGEPTPTPFAPPPVLHAEGWCPGPKCPDPHHEYARAMGLEEVRLG